VVARLASEGFRVVNADITVVAQAPRLGQRMDQMRACIAGILAVPENAVNVKATTTERLGYLGRGEGLAAHAVALIDEAT
jgi:2-C-methyl-D-erythritol 2,4-cyclodiphosphate synthase